MKKLALLILFSFPSFAATYAAASAVLLDAGANSLTIHDLASGTDIPMTFSPGASERVRVMYSPGVYVPPDAGTVYSTCANPCTVNQWFSWGQMYYWPEYVDSMGAVLSPRKRGQAAGAYASNTVGGIGTLPMIEPAVTTTSPLPMPREVIGQDGFVNRFQLPLLSGHASTSVLLFFRIYAGAYNTTGRYDGKCSIQVNSGSWLPITNANSDLEAVGEERYVNRSGDTINQNNPIVKVGGYAQVREYTLALTSNPIGSSDTTVQIGGRHNGTEGVGSGCRFLEIFPIEGTYKTITQIVCLNNSCEATSNGHGYSNGNSFLLLGAPGLRALDGPQVITAVTTNTFTFTPHAQGSGGSKPAIYVVADGTYTVPVDRTPIPTISSTQPVMRAARMLVATTSFTYTDPATWVAPPTGDAVQGGIDFTTASLVNPNFPYVGNTLNAHCSDCHSPSGADLKYYNFSNETIEQRAIFHGLSFQKALNIAAFIRGNSISVPAQARPWNPPMQPGPGMDQFTWRRSDSSLTDVVCGPPLASNTCKATVNSTVGLALTDPLIVSGATVDTDLNTQTIASTTWRVASIPDSTHFTFTTTNVSNNTYNESTLIINMANGFMAGCGIDCRVQYGYDDMLTYFGTDKTKWVWNSWLDARLIPMPWQFPDWNKGWLSAVWPGEFAAASWTSSAPYSHYQTLLSSITPGNFASYKAAGYTDSPSQLIGEFYNYLGRQSPGQAPGFTLLPDAAAGSIYPAQLPLFRISASQQFNIMTWTLAVEYGTLGMDAQRQTDINGPATATGCYRQWGLPLGYFDLGAHKFVFSEKSILGGGLANFNIHSNIWYMLTPAIASNNCFDGPNSPVDLGYTAGFLEKLTTYRPAGYAAWLLEQVVVPQAGGQWTDWYNYNGQNGRDGAGPMLGYTFAPNYWWMTIAKYNQIIEDLIDMSNAQFASETSSYWENVISATNPLCHGAAQAWTGSTYTSCDESAYLLSLAAQAGINSTKLATFKANAKSITLAPWLAHDFDADEAAGSEADNAIFGTNYTVSSNISDPGGDRAVTITYTGGACPFPSGVSPTPLAWMVVNSTGGEVPEYVYANSGTCAAKGGNGTLVVHTTYAHTGTPIVTGGCSKTKNPFPNYGFNFSSPWFRCASNMY